MNHLIKNYFKSKFIILNLIKNLINFNDNNVDIKDVFFIKKVSK